MTQTIVILILRHVLFRLMWHTALEGEGHPATIVLSVGFHGDMAAVGYAGEEGEADEDAVEKGVGPTMAIALQTQLPGVSTYPFRFDGLHTRLYPYYFPVGESDVEGGAVGDTGGQTKFVGSTQTEGATIGA